MATKQLEGIRCISMPVKSGVRGRQLEGSFLGIFISIAGLSSAHHPCPSRANHAMFPVRLLSLWRLISQCELKVKVKRETLAYFYCPPCQKEAITFKHPPHTLFNFHPSPRPLSPSPLSLLSQCNIQAVLASSCQQRLETVLSEDSQTNYFISGEGGKQTDEINCKGLVQGKADESLHPGPRAELQNGL